tara:strand:- start:96 stop:401 length:306 start_codon:yes stop_codon:yes gene_type:complete
MKYNLDAYRCPDATILMRKAISQFMGNTDVNSLCLSSIEPSLENNLKAFIEHQGLPITISKIDSTPISQEQREQWLDNFDEEDFEDVSNINSFYLKKQVDA